jgi:hypothetical protein
MINPFVNYMLWKIFSAMMLENGRKIVILQLKDRNHER